MSHKIPRILHRTVPRETSAEAETFWDGWTALHPDWVPLTWRDPLLKGQNWETAHLWKRCQAGAQKAGMVRLEVLWRYGGVYVDSDLEPVRNLAPLCNVSGWGAREDENCIPDFVMGFAAGHPAIRQCLDIVLKMDPAKESPWYTGPGVTTQVFQRAARMRQMIIHPPVRFAPYHWKKRGDTREESKPWGDNPETYGIHRWRGSWLT
jgi:mannosyltransferase OCH1-like enzyme